jgi:hypothetical protein
MPKILHALLITSILFYNGLNIKFFVIFNFLPAVRNCAFYEYQAISIMCRILGTDFIHVNKDMKV